MVEAIDFHNHLGRWLSGWVGRPGEWVVADVGAFVATMDEHGIAAVVNLDGRWGDELEANLDRYDRAHPGRFATFCHVDWADVEAPARLIASLERSRDAGARGLKVWKDLGLEVIDAAGARVLPDDPRLHDLWAAAGALGLPVLIHTADPAPFWQPVDARNERYEELLEHPEWSYADARFPTWERLLEALEATVAAHPRTTFVGAHVLSCVEDLDWVERVLAAYPNLHFDPSARAADLRRRGAAPVRELFARRADRIVFGTDEFPPTPADWTDYRELLGRDLALDDATVRQICSGTARRLLAFDRIDV